MSEQILWLGEEQMLLKPLDESLDPLVEEKRHQRETVEHAAKMLVRDLISQQIVDEHIQKQLEDSAEVLLEAPFSAYAEEFVKFMTVAKANKEIAEAHTILEALRGQTVFDVGNGLKPHILQDFLKNFGIRSYIGVDTNNMFDQRHEIRRLDDFGDVMYLDELEDDVVEGVLVRGDMLRVASRLPDQSVSVSLMGIDEYVVNTQTPYGIRLKEELARIMHPNGLIFGRQAHGAQDGLLGKLERLPNLERIGTHVGGLHFIRTKEA